MSYTIAGKQIKNQYLAIGTFAATYLAYKGISGGGVDESKKPAASKGPVPVKEDPSISADSKDELDFIRQFVSDAEGEKH